MADKMLLPASIGPLTPREAVIDALSRCINGLDQEDEQLFRSAFTSNAKFTLFGRTLNGMDEIMSDLWNPISKLDTTHFVTNHRVHIDGAKARLTATALAQHYKRGTGTQGDAPRYLSGVFYDVEVVKQDGEEPQWRVSDWKLNALWAEGDQSVMKP